MRYFKHFLAILFILVIGIGSAYIAEDSLEIIWAIISLLLLLHVINFVFRSNLKMKSFYTSPVNILTSVFKRSKEYELSSDILFEKAIEELEKLNDSRLKIDQENKLALATTSISFKSWGENIYITVIELGNGKSRLIYESVALQAYSWGKNEDNGSAFLNHMEESFII